MKIILVADDEEPIRKLLEGELSEEGYRVVLAANAREALKIVETKPIEIGRAHV